jgi:predicted  nucleic acid-binding Zn-ribbon protein
MDKVDQLAAAAKEAEKNLAAGKQEMEKTRQSVDASVATIRADLTRLEGELKTSEQSLPSDVKADYQRVVRSKGADSLASVDDGVCTGCGQQITLNMTNELKLNKLVFCKACGRLLYLPE